MTVDDKIRDEKLQCDINREAGKMALSSGKSDKYEYLMGEEILPFDQSRVIEQAKFNYSPLGKTLEKQVDTWNSLNLFKACSHYFLQNLIFSRNDSPSKTMKSVFYFTSKVLFVLEIF